MYIIFIAVVLLAGLFAYHYIFNIYETDFSVEPKSLFADNQSIVVIRAIPINAFGWEAPFRKSPASFEIREGKELIEIVEQDNSKGILILRAKNKPGKVVVFVKSKFALFPSSFEIAIYPNAA